MKFGKTTKYIHEVRKSTLLEIIEKSFPTEYGDIKVYDNPDNIVVEVYAPFPPKGQIAKLTFTDYDVKIESPIDFPRNDDMIVLRFISLMEYLFEKRGYKEDFIEAHKTEFGLDEPGEGSGFNK